ncbi:hypothetical protein ACTFIR_011641 [Dictyostelium discoideum]
MSTNHFNNNNNKNNKNNKNNEDNYWENNTQCNNDRNKFSIDNIINNPTATTTNTITSTTNQTIQNNVLNSINIKNNESLKNIYYDENLQRKLSSINFLKNLCSVRDQPFNYNEHLKSIQSINSYRKCISNEIFKKNLINNQLSDILIIIEITSFIGDCIFEIFYLNYFQETLEKDILLFSNASETICIPSQHSPSPQFPGYYTENIDNAAPSTVVSNSPNNYSQPISPQSSQSTTPTIISSNSPLKTKTKNNNNNNK